MNEVAATLLHRAWRKVDIKLTINGDMHVLRWRRKTFIDEVLFDDRLVATSKGVFGREAIYGLNIAGENDAKTKLVLMIDAEPDWNLWSSEGQPGGVRLENADEAILAIGSLGPDRMEPFRQLYDRAIKAIGLS